MQGKSTIQIDVELDDKKHPDKIYWSASENPQGKEPIACKAFLLSVFDEVSADTFRIDLWTSKLQVAEMDRLMFQTFKSMADTYFKATNNHELANVMHNFAMYFGEQTGIVPKEENENLS